MNDPREDDRAGHGRLLLWPGLVFLLLGSQVLLILVMAYVASSDRSFAVEPDYYQRGLHWDKIAAQQRHSERLGWQAKLELGDDVNVLGERTLRCLLRGRGGEAIASARVDVIAFPHARGREQTRVTLTESAAGVYETPLRFRRKGLWEFRLTARWRSEVFTHVEQRDVYPPGESRPWRR